MFKVREDSRNTLVMSFKRHFNFDQTQNFVIMHCLEHAWGERLPSKSSVFAYSLIHCFIYPAKELP